MSQAHGVPAVSTLKDKAKTGYESLAPLKRIVKIAVMTAANCSTIAQHCIIALCLIVKSLMAHPAQIYMQEACWIMKTACALHS